ncbi:MAG: cytochrome c [Proteobacteria bacterium]|nr:cytochrome c [Pseudomonadota bacterium]
MKKRSALIIIFTLIVGLSGLSSKTFAETAKNNYRLYCSQCHGLTGNGEGIDKPTMGVAPKIHNNAEEMIKLKDADIYTVTAQGGASVTKSALMPPWEGVMSEAEIKDMVKYLRELCNCTEK